MFIFLIFNNFRLYITNIMMWENAGKSLNSIKLYNLIMITKGSNEHIIRGDIKKLHIGSILLKVFEKSIKIKQIPKLEFCEIKERILESYIDIKKKK